MEHHEIASLRSRLGILGNPIRIWCVLLSKLPSNSFCMLYSNKSVHLKKLQYAVLRLSPSSCPLKYNAACVLVCRNLNLKSVLFDIDSVHFANTNLWYKYLVLRIKCQFVDYLTSYLFIEIVDRNDYAQFGDKLYLHTISARLVRKTWTIYPKKP